jgi:hypothetical protein
VNDLGEMRRRLEHEERKAREELLRARIKFNEVLADVRGTIPQSDGNLLIQQAGANVRVLNLQYTAASRRLMDYLVYGVIPEDFMASPPKTPDESARGGDS